MKGEKHSPPGYWIPLRRKGLLMKAEISWGWCCVKLDSSLATRTHLKITATAHCHMNGNQPRVAKTLKGRGTGLLFLKRERRPPIHKDRDTVAIMKFFCMNHFISPFFSFSLTIQYRRGRQQIGWQRKTDVVSWTRTPRLCFQSTDMHLYHLECLASSHSFA